MPNKILPGNHYRRRALCRVPVALGKGSFALGKAFAECNTRQRASVESPPGKGCFAECQISGTRQRFDVVGRRSTPSIFLKTLCRVPQLRHSAKKSVFLNLFAECHSTDTRQRVFLFFFKFSLPSAMVIALGKATSKFLFFVFCFSI